MYFKIWTYENLNVLILSREGEFLDIIGFSYWLAGLEFSIVSCNLFFKEKYKILLHKKY